MLLYSCSQSLQDFFVWKILKQKTNGYFLDIGAGTGGIPFDPLNPGFYSNTYLLEKQGWNGVCVDFDEPWCSQVSQYRENANVQCVDLMKTSINKVLENQQVPSYVDYLSFDVDDAQATVMKELDFSKYKFGIITYEHNLFQSLDDSPQNHPEEWRARIRKQYEQDREKFLTLGYKLLWGNVILDGYGPVEDWWVSEKIYNENKHLVRHDVNCEEVLAI
tara:strand:+ start:242 stop:898 length:657 start_codon:yes stop_codon:yes gene_type:complete